MFIINFFAECFGCAKKRGSEKSTTIDQISSIYQKSQGLNSSNNIEEYFEPSLHAATEKSFSDQSSDFISIETKSYHSVYNQDNPKSAFYKKPISTKGMNEKKSTFITQRPEEFLKT